MKSIAAIVLAFAIPALAQTVLDLPQCAQSPILVAIQGSGCPLTDINCICKKQSFVDGLVEAIPKVCTLEQTYFVSDFAIRLCGAADVTISLPSEVLSATEAPSTSATPSPLSITSTPSVSTTSILSSVTTILSSASAASSTAVGVSSTSQLASSSVASTSPTTTARPNAGAAQTAGLIGLIGAVAVGVLGGL